MKGGDRSLPPGGAPRLRCMTRLSSAWRALTPDQRLAGGASAALFVTMFLPWYQQNAVVNAPRAAPLQSRNLNAFQVFSFVEAAVLLVALAVLYLLFARGERRSFQLPGGDGSVVFAAGIWVALLLVTLISLPATIAVRPSALDNYEAHKILYLIPALVVATLVGILSFTRQRKPLAAFLSSCLYLVFMLVGAAVGLYPTLLPSSTDPARDITIATAITGSHSLHVGLIWWSFGLLLALAYIITSYRLFRGKVTAEAGYGH